MYVTTLSLWSETTQYRVDIYVTFTSQEHFNTAKSENFEHLLQSLRKKIWSGRERPDLEVMGCDGLDVMDGTPSRLFTIVPYPEIPQLKMLLQMKPEEYLSSLVGGDTIELSKLIKAIQNTISGTPKAYTLVSGNYMAGKSTFLHLLNKVSQATWIYINSEVTTFPDIPQGTFGIVDLGCKYDLNQKLFIKPLNYPLWFIISNESVLATEKHFKVPHMFAFVKIVEPDRFFVERVFTPEFVNDFRDFISSC